MLTSSEIHPEEHCLGMLQTNLVSTKQISQNNLKRFPVLEMGKLKHTKKRKCRTYVLQLKEVSQSPLIKS